MNGDGYSRDGRGRGPRDYPRSDRDDRRDRGDRGDRGDRHHRRSRSPYGRGSRRRDDDDPYASSRSHREREREDRYSNRDSGRDRRGDREWDRDRGSSRRDARRDDDDRYSRRADRDQYVDDRRRGGRDRNDDASGRRERHRSASPPPKKREPTPDLTNITSVLQRKRRLTQWDIKPPGYENVTSEQAKLSGMFPLPGAPRQQQPMDPTKLQAFMKEPNSQVNNGALKPSNSRQAKRIIVSNLPKSATEESVMSFFNLQLNGLNVIDSTDPCVLCQLSNDGSYCIVEFRGAPEATVGLALDGTTMEADDAADGAATSGLQIRRPKDYIVPAVDEVPYEPGVVSNVVLDTQNKISIINMPSYLTDEQVTELLVSFGELKAFILVRDRSTDESRGIAFCEYVDPAATDVAIQGLNNMDLGDRKIRVQRASIGATQVSGVEMGVAAMSMLAGTTATDSDESRVLQLLNMVTADELIDNDDYEEIKEDVQEECAKYGNVVDIKIPRPIGGSRQSAGVGKIFVKYDSQESTKKALQALAGRKFADRTVVTTYFPEENFDVGAW